MRKKIVIYSILVFLILAFLQNCVSKKNIVSQSNIEKGKNLLALYGEQIFISESCSDCHTQDISQESQTKISLDGLGGKYPDSWYFNYFLDPQSMIPASKKASLIHLYRTPFTNSILKNIASTHKVKLSTVQLKEEILVQSNKVRIELEKSKIQINNTEIIALMSYLQQIPSTKEMLRLDSLGRLEMNANLERWRLIAENEYNEVIKFVNNEGVENGKELYTKNCSPCHGKEGGGFLGPNLTDKYWLHGGSDVDIIKTIVNGVKERGMISWKLNFTPKEVGELVAFIDSLQETNPINAKPPQGTLKE